MDSACLQSETRLQASAFRSGECLQLLLDELQGKPVRRLLGFNRECFQKPAWFFTSVWPSYVGIYTSMFLTVAVRTIQTPRAACSCPEEPLLRGPDSANFGP